MTRGARAVARVGLWWPTVAAFVVLALLWQVVALHNRYLIPTVSQIWDQLVGRPGLYWHDLLVTLQEAVVGASLGMLAAFVLAVGMCQVRLLERALMPLAVLLNVTPVVAIAPGLAVAFGFGFAPKYIVTAVIVFFPFLVNSLIGLRSADPQVEEVFRSLHASASDMLLRLRVPNSLPFLFAAARICMPLSLIGAVVGEFSASGNNGGLGSLIITASDDANLRAVYASVVLLALLGLALTLLVVILQRQLLGWHQISARSGQ